MTEEEMQDELNAEEDEWRQRMLDLQYENYDFEYGDVKY